MGGRGWERGSQSGCGAKHRGRIAAVLVAQLQSMTTARLEQTNLANRVQQVARE